MHISCPSCQTVFAVDDDLIPAEGGRKVRCSVCENIWQASRGDKDEDISAPLTDTPTDTAIDTASTSKPMADPASDPTTPDRRHQPNQPDAMAEDVVPPRSGEGARSREKRRRLPRPLTMIISGVAMLAIIIGGAVIWRNIVSAIFPSTIAIFETVGLPVMPDTSVIRFEAIRGERNGDTVRIRGEVMNNGIWPTHAPPIFISVQDMIGTVLAVKEVELDELVIPAGGRLPLNVQLTLDEPLRPDVDTEIVAIPVARMPGNRQ